jgi:3-deoxy-7-phosphoheptulonate synthase
MESVLNNRKIVASRRLPTPSEVATALTPCESAIATVSTARATVQNILNGDDNRLLLIVGPCSIHDMRAARDYAQRLKDLADEVGSQLVLVMRTYFEKPRTVGGWKGLLNDPHLDGSCLIEEGILQARSFLLECARRGLPTATEMLDLISPQFLADLVSWSAIGARTTESQSHRELASGLSMPVGFKNATNGDVQIAVNAIKSAAQSHHFLSVDSQGKAAMFETKGNPDCHVVLRGGTGPNYERQFIDDCARRLEEARLQPRVIVDCSHGNSAKDFRRQGGVLKNCMEQVCQDLESDKKPVIRGLMIESNLNEGNQKFPCDPGELSYGVSITDQCIGWDETRSLILEAAEQLARLLPKENAEGKRVA